jgi:hypothetical protein
MTLNHLVVMAIALFLSAAGMSTAKAPGQSNSQPLANLDQNRDVDLDAWDTPPKDLQVIQLKGFRDGIVGARKDFDKHREPNLNGREEYRNPHLPAGQKEAYRDGFSLGYGRGASHFVGGPDQPVDEPGQHVQEPAPRGSGALAVADPARGSEIQRRGFQDGMARARKELDTHRRPAANDRDESRQLKLPPDLRLQYLAAFCEGYDHFMSLRAGEPLNRR